MDLTQSRRWLCPKNGGQRIKAHGLPCGELLIVQSVGLRLKEGGVQLRVLGDGEPRSTVLEASSAKREKEKKLSQ